MYKISREEVTEKEPFSVITHIFKMLGTTFISGIILMILVGIYLAFYGHSGSFYEQVGIVQLIFNVGMFAMALSVVAMVVLGLVRIIAALWTPDPSRSLEIPDRSNLRLVRIEDGPWGSKYIYESDREL